MACGPTILLTLAGGLWCVFKAGVDGNRSRALKGVWIMGEPGVFLLANVAVAFYNVGTIWAHEIDTFRTWAIIDSEQFHDVQKAHWRKLPYWVFAPVALAMIGSFALILYHPKNSPGWVVGLPALCQGLSIVLTAIFWGPWQAKLSQDPLGPQSPYLAKILKTHWVRTLLISANAAFLMAWAILVST